MVSITGQEITLELCAKRWSELNQAQVRTEPGHIDVKLDWKEYLSEEIESNGQQKGRLAWCGNYSTKLPGSTKKISVETILFNGQKNIATKSWVLNKILHLNYDAARQKLVFTQNIPSELSID